MVDIQGSSEVAEYIPPEESEFSEQFLLDVRQVLSVYKELLDSIHGRAPMSESVDGEEGQDQPDALSALAEKEIKDHLHYLAQLQIKFEGLHDHPLDYTPTSWIGARGGRRNGLRYRETAEPNLKQLRGKTQNQLDILVETFSQGKIGNSYNATESAAFRARTQEPIKALDRRRQDEKLMCVTLNTIDSEYTGVGQPPATTYHPGVQLWIVGSQGQERTEVSGVTFVGDQRHSLDIDSRRIPETLTPDAIKGFANFVRREVTAAAIAKENRGR